MNGGNNVDTKTAANERKRRTTQAANWMHRIMIEFGPDKLARRPERKVCEDLIDAAPWNDIRRMLGLMHVNKERPAAKYRWFVEQAHWRIHGTTPEQLRGRRNAERSIARDARERAAYEATA